MARGWVEQLPSLTIRRGRYSYRFDLYLSPTRHSKGRLSKWLSTEGHAPEGSQQGLDLPRKDVGNCKPDYPSYTSAMTTRQGCGAVRTAAQARRATVLSSWRRRLNR